MAPASRVHIYCRVSSVGQEDNHSLDTQEAACRQWVKDRAFALASVWREVWSGTDRHRPELDRLLSQIGAGDIVLAYDLDRLSRGGQIDTAVLIDRIESAGASVSFVTGDFEASETGAFIRSARAFVAALEHQKITERTQRGRRARVESGKPIVSPVAAYGYRWREDKSGYDLDPETAPVARMIFDWALAGVSLRGIAVRLRERGIPSPTGRAHWTPAVIRNLLLRPIYTGDHVAYRKRVERRPGGRYVARAGTAGEQVVVPNVAPPLVTMEEHAAVVARLAGNKTRSTRNNRHPEAALLRAGFAVCGHCGWSLAVANPPAHRLGSTAQYRCVRREREGGGCSHPTIATSVIDDAVWANVASVLRNPAVIAREVARLRADGGLDRERTAIDKVLAGITEKQGRLARAIASLNDEAATAPLLAELTALAERRKAASDELAALDRRIADRDADAAKVKNITEWCRRVGANVDQLSYDDKRMALEALGVRVLVYRPGTTDAEGDPISPLGT